MADFDDIIQEINENIPDNNTQSITAKKLRDTLVDLTDAIETQQSEFEDGIQTQQSDFETNITNRQEAFENDVDEQLSSINTQFATGQNIGDVGIDDEPTAGSENLVKSGGIVKKLYGYVDMTVEGEPLSLPSSPSVGGFNKATSATATGDYSCAWNYGGYTRHVYINLINVKKEGYKYLKVVANPTYTSYLTFVKKLTAPSTTSNKSFDSLVSDGYLSSVHSNYDKVLITCPSNRTTNIEIPDDAVGVCVQYKSRNDGGGSTSTSARKPESITPTGLFVNGDITTIKETLDKLPDETHLVNPSEESLAFAKDVMQLKLKLEGVTANETKVIETPITGSYVKGTDGTLGVNNGYAYIEVALENVNYVRFLGGLFTSASYISGYAFGHYTNLSDPTTWVTDKASGFDVDVSVGWGTKEYVIEVPEGATHFRITTAIPKIPELAQNFYCYLQSGTSVDSVIEGLGKVTGQLSDVVDDLYGTLTEITETPKMKIRSGSLDPSSFYPVASNTIIEIKLESTFKKVNITAQPNLYFILFVSKSELPTSASTSSIALNTMRSQYMAVCDGFAPDSNQYRIVINSGASIELILNEDCKYLYLSKYYSSADRTPSSIIVTKIERVGGVIEQITDDELKDHSYLKLIIKDGKCFTSPIPLEKGIYITVKQNYRLTNAYLVNHLTGEIVNDDFITAAISSATNEIYRRRSNLCKMPGYDVIYQIEKLDGTPIQNNDAIVDEFAAVEDLYRRKLPDDIDSSIYRAFRDKVQTSIGNVWIPSLKAANKISTSNGDTNEKHYRRGVTYLGVNYSGPTQWGKHVGIEVSMRTFKTAVANPRSVMYTERIGAYSGTPTKSAYGFTHASYAKEGGAYYGCVCTGLTSYLLGLNSVITSDSWRVVGSTWGSTMFNIVMQGTAENPNTILCGESEYRYDNDNDCRELATMLQPMDFIWKDGHCAVISDIYVDEWEEVKYIVISEQTTPTSTSNAYSPHFFFLRFKNNVDAGYDWQILRRKESFPWTLENASIPRVGQDKEFVIMNNSQYNPVDLGEIDDDITTFAGEYATFVIGDYADTTNNFKMFLNIHRGGSDGYTHLQIFNENDDVSVDTPLEIDITNYAIDTSLGDNGYILPTDQEEDWIIYNLAEYWRVNQPNTTGKFKARVVRKENNSVVSYSGCTHFEFIKIEVSIDQSNNFGFVVKGGVPVQYREEAVNGLIGDATVKDLLPSDYTTEGDTHTGTNLTIPSRWPSGHIRLFVKTDYGMANRRIAYTKPA